MDKFIKTYEVFDESLCKSIIETYENCEKKQRVENGGVPDFTQVNLNTAGKFDKFVQLLCYKTVDVIKRYKKDLPEYVEWFPDRFFFEEFRIKKYDPGSDQFGLHTDVQDHMSAKRYLAFLFYLNDDFVGGETDFPYNELTVQPKTGRVLVFPPT